MRHLMTGSRTMQFNGVVARWRHTFARTSSLLAIAGILSFTAANAKDPLEKEVKPHQKGAAVQPHSEAAVIPECLEKLKLTAKQQDQIKEIMRSYDVSINTVWKQFGDRYMQTIRLESSMLAAIEDNLTEAQRQQVRDQRRKTAAHEKLTEATNEKPNQAKTRPADTVEDELAAASVSLSTEQEAMADKIQEKYRPQLRSMNRDIQGLHTRLVSLEADKLVAIEKVLTKEQLAELRSNRQNAPVPTKVEITSTGPTKTE